MLVRVLIPQQYAIPSRITVRQFACISNCTLVQAGIEYRSSVISRLEPKDCYTQLSHYERKYEHSKTLARSWRSVAVWRVVGFGADGRRSQQGRRPDRSAHPQAKCQLGISRT